MSDVPAVLYTMIIRQPAVKKCYFSMEETLWRLTPYKDTVGTGLSILSISYKTVQHEDSHDVVLTMEPIPHPYTDLHHCQVFHPVTIEG